MPALGGYLVPPMSTFGSQVQRSSSGTLSMTMATWEPQPHHVDLPQLSQVAFLHIFNVKLVVCTSLCNHVGGVVGA